MYIPADFNAQVTAAKGRNFYSRPDHRKDFVGYCEVYCRSLFDGRQPSYLKCFCCLFDDNSVATEPMSG